MGSATQGQHPSGGQDGHAAPKPGPGAPARLIGLYTAHREKLWALGDQVMVSGVNFLTIAAIARPLGPEGLGLFFWAYVVFLFFKAVHIAVIVSPMMSLGPKQAPDDQPGYYGTVLVHQALLAVVTAVLIPPVLQALYLFDAEIDVRHLAVPLIAATLGDQIQDAVRRYLFTKAKPMAAFLNDTIAYMGRLALLVGLPLLAGVVLDGALTFWIMAGFSVAAALIGAFWFEPLRIARTSLVRISRSHWDFSKWLFGMSVLQFCSGHAIIMVAGVVLGAVAMGAIRSTLNILAPIQVLTLALQNVAPMRASTLYKEQGAGALVTYLTRLAGIGLAISLGIAALGWLFAEEIVGLLYGPDFVPYAYLINWWVIILTVRFLQFPLEVGLRAIEYTQPLFVTVAIEAVFGLGTAYFLAAWFGIPGTMTGLIVAHVIPVTVLTILLRRRLAPELVEAQADGPPTDGRFLRPGRGRTPPSGA
ncbi:MAG: lipopolysaccharide biosynthesis protein [Alphaproteobacteria bacterium]